MAERKPRAATTTTTAKRAAAIAKAEGEEAAEEKPKKKRGRPPGSVKKKAPQSPSPEPEPAEEEIEIVDPDIDDIDWKNEEGIQLTWKLITAIEDGDDIRASLFPPVGANKLSGGKKKSEYQYQLAKVLFAEHPKFKESFAQAKTAKEKKPFYTKIKNRVDALTKKTRGQIEEMGQTGAGIGSEEDIQPGTAFTTKWDLIKEDSPWFFHMRSLVGERPNLVHTGLGNNDSEVDMSILLGGDRDADDSSSLAPDDIADLPGQLTRSPSVTAVDLDGSDSDDLPRAPTLESVKKGGIKRKQPDAVNSSESLDMKPPVKKTQPKPAISQPAPKKTPVAKPVTVKDKFTAAVLAEEQTAQEHLKLKRAKNTDRKEVQLEKLRLQAEAKAEKSKAKMEILRMKMAQEHEYRMAQLRAGPSQPQAGPSSHSGAYAGDSQSQFGEYTSSGSGGSSSFDLSGALDAFDSQFAYPYNNGSGE
ncbi:hypothetical protein B0H16DRAFT_1856801 [Mycena metata]|uniref:Uncharacterized protein n=1 Tax=Mycena metata TaxID=1033252 RepID=A0AAD7IKI4_9AGAR|nr:hypothetical protein B0H16DRAFT_1856801 [Mycena metata]